MKKSKMTVRDCIVLGVIGLFIVSCFVFGGDTVVADTPEIGATINLTEEGFFRLTDALQGAESESFGDFFLGARDSTNITNPWTFEDPVTLEGTLAVTGATTFTGVSTFTAAPVFSAETVTVNGVTTTYKRDASFASASTTPCSLQAPSATSTLVYAAISFTVSSTTATEIELGNGGLNNTATTTQIGDIVAIAANAKTTIVASSTPSTGADRIFAPNEYLVWKLQSGFDSTYSPTGVCTAEFKSTI